MSNRIYLHCTDFSTIPRPEEWEDFYKSSGVEYEASASIPLFWLCIFDASNVHLVPTDHNGFEDDWRSYAYLKCDRLEGVTRLRSRADMMKSALSQNRYSLYLEWMERLEAEPGANILVRTAELDWMCEDGELERDLKKTLGHLEKVSAEGVIRLSNAMKEMVGLWDGEELNECESCELVGCANSGPEWPSPFMPRPQKVDQVIDVKKPWWVFWR
jgi:hypothetical protein